MTATLTSHVSTYTPTLQDVLRQIIAEENQEPDEEWNFIKTCGFTNDHIPAVVEEWAKELETSRPQYGQYGESIWEIMNNGQTEYEEGHFVYDQVDSLDRLSNIRPSKFMLAQIVHRKCCWTQYAYDIADTLYEHIMEDFYNDLGEICQEMFWEHVGE